MNISEDLDLICQLQEGKIKAFDTLYFKYHGAIYANIFKFTKDPLAASDLLQEVFITLWEKRYDLAPHQSVASWLFVISFNKSVNYAKRALRELKINENFQQTIARHHQAGLETEHLEKQYHLLQQAIAHLPLQKRKVFTLCKLEGKSYEETATILNISKNTVKEHLSISMHAVRTFVNQHSESLYSTCLLAVLQL